MSRILFICLYACMLAGHGKFVDAELVSALTTTATAAAAHLTQLAETNPKARSVMKGQLRIAAKLTLGFMQAIKDPALYDAIMQLRRMLSS